jgi:hypothetical protein
MMSQTMSTRATRILWPVVWTVIGIAALIALLVLNATAREVAAATTRTLVGLFTTPFILEGTVAMVGVLLVLGINRWRLDKEGDGWVYLVTQEPDSAAGKVPAAITQRLQGIVMQEKPETMDEAGIARAKVEGFLELGMAAQAAEALSECDSLPDDELTAALRIRVMAANLDTAAAQQLLRASAGRFAETRILFAQTALDCADWLESHAPRHRDTVQLWHAEVQPITG